MLAQARRKRVQPGCSLAAASKDCMPEISELTCHRSYATGTKGHVTGAPRRPVVEERGGCVGVGRGQAGVGG